MKNVLRIDTTSVGATFTEEGFLKDTPIITRSGVFEYLDHNGSIRRELRPTEEVLKMDSLATLKGKPIIVTHAPGRVNAENAKKHTVGTILSEGIPENNNIKAEIIIHDKASLDSGLRELSCGYLVDLEMAPGEYNGEKYDCIQRNIKYNHLALVKRARAGEKARLNLDGDEEYEEERNDKAMAMLKLDSGIEYEVSPEVEVAYKGLQVKLDGKQTEIDRETAKKDILQAKLDGKDQEIEKVKNEYTIKLDSAVKERIELLKTAESFKIDKVDEMSNSDIKKAVIKAVRGDSINLDEKSEVYIEAAYDMAKTEKRTDGIEKQRKALNDDKFKEDGKDGYVSSSDARNNMMHNMQNAYKEGK